MANALNDLQISAVLEKHRRFIPAAEDSQRFAQPGLLTGIEIELEDWDDDFANHKIDIRTFWTEHDEGSLRNGREFVLYPPRNGEQLADAIDTFFNFGAKWNPSERASVHVHLDMLGDVTVAQFRAMFALFYALEGAIYRVADENRKWASYSCPLIDMRNDRLVNLLAAKTIAAFKRGLVGDYHEEKYYGFNAVSLSKHGTIELRYFPCTTNKDTLISWINLCHELYAAAMKHDVITLANEVRKLGVEDFIRTYLPRSAGDLLVYTDASEVLMRLAECVAIYSDNNAVKAKRFVERDDGLKNSAYRKMLEKVCAPIFALEKKKQEMDAIEVDVDQLYRALLKQANAANNNGA